MAKCSREEGRLEDAALDGGEGASPGAHDARGAGGEARFPGDAPPDEGRPSYVGDYNGPVEDARAKVSIGLPMVLLSVAAGFVVGAFVWAVLGLANGLVRFLWVDVRNAVDVVWYPLALCTAGGLAIGLWTSVAHTVPKPLHEVMAEVKKTGGYRTGAFGKSVVSFLLPIAFGGSVGPEAGLTGVIAEACTWIGDTLKRAGLKAKSVADFTLAATLSAIFGTPFAGMAAAAQDALPDADDYSFRRSAKIVLYTAAAFGAFAGVKFVVTVFHVQGGLPRFDAPTFEPSEFLWMVPLVVAGYVLAVVYFAADKASRAARTRLGRHTVLAPVACGVVIGVAAMFFPFVLFSGQEQSVELMGAWTAFSASALLATGVLKAALTPLCINMGWVGGNFFPLIFSGVSFGYGFAALAGIDPVFCVMTVTSALLAGVTRKPLLTMALLVLCFPIDGILWMGLSAVVCAAVPVPRVLAGDGANGNSAEKGR